MRASRRSFFPAAAALLLVYSPGQAQTLEFRLREEANAAPVVGAIGRLLNDKGHAVAQALSDDIGRLVLRAPGPGTYRIKIDRIGWSGLVTGPFPLSAGETVRHEVLMTSSRLELPVLAVEARSGCDAGAQGGALASMLWEEIQKALTANVLTQRARAIPLHVREFVREAGLSGQGRPAMDGPDFTIWQRTGSDCPRCL